MPGRKYILDERTESILKRHYDSNSETIDLLCRVLGVPRYTIKRWAQVLGLARPIDRNWSEQDVAHLEANFHRLHVSTLARKLKRSTTAVALKAKRLGIRKCGEGYTLQSLSLALGVDVHKVSRWVKRGLIKTSRRQTDRDRDHYYISERAVREFIRNHPSGVDTRRTDGLWLIDLLANGQIHLMRSELAVKPAKEDCHDNG
jgi:predicted site-specific integrase-resolvase